MDVTVTPLKPSDPDAWNNLCLKCSNLVQSSYYDGVQLFFNQTPLYYEVWDGNRLIGGTKIYLYESKKLPSFIRNISSFATLFSEIIFDETVIDLEKVVSFISNGVTEVIKERKIVGLKESGYYGGRELLPVLDFKSVKKTEFNVAYFNLKSSKEELWGKIKESHRRNINKAQKNGVAFKISEDINEFIALINETYKTQNQKAPNDNYLRHLFKTLKERAAVKICFSTSEGKNLAGAFVIQYGKNADYAFGGNMKNNIGAGHFLHWNIALYYQSLGFSKYSLGQVAAGSNFNPDNEKFFYGITRFKKDFGTEESPSLSKEYIFNPLKRKVWLTIQKLIARK